MIEFLKHTADVKFRVSGATEEIVFEESVKAFCEYVVGKEKIANINSRTLVIEGNDKCEMLYKLMDELVFLLDSENFLANSASVSLHRDRLKVKLMGEKADKYELSQVKAATYAEMYFEKKDNKWEAQVVLDV